MKLSTNTQPLWQFDLKTAISMIKKADFDAFDLSLFCLMNKYNNYFCGPDYVKKAEELKKYTDSIGIVCNQAHAPFMPFGEELIKEIYKSVEIAAVFEADNIIIHPVMDSYNEGNEERLKKANYEFYSKLLRHAENCGIKICTENMWKEKDGKIIPSVCGTPDMFRDYVDMLDNDNFSACLDIGHVPLVGEDISEMINTLGGKRLKALHVHDNDFLHDSHSLPYSGKIDFDLVCRELAHIGYSGDFTFEPDGGIGNYPKELKQDALNLLSETGRYLMEKIEQYR